MLSKTALTKYTKRGYDVTFEVFDYKKQAKGAASVCSVLRLMPRTGGALYWNRVLALCCSSKQLPR
jgi:hypothetical protein